METFEALRKKARDLRDQAIDEAREQYADRLTRIMALEQELHETKKQRWSNRLTHAISQVMPKDRAFTTVDIYAGLEALDEKRSYQKTWVISHLGKLCDRGILRRVQKNHGREHAIYACVGVEAGPIPFECKTMPVAIEAILAEHGGELLPAEIAVRLRERG